MMSRTAKVLHLTNLLKNGYISKKLFAKAITKLYQKRERFKDYSYVKSYNPSSSIEEGKIVNILRVKTK